MKIIVLLKEVPDMNTVKFDSERGVVNRSSAEAEINPFDLNGLQAAVHLKKETDCEIVAVTMGPPKAEKSLRDAYARGADRCVLLTDRKFGGSDTLATSLTLAAAIQKIGQYDLIICGEKSVDGDTAQVGAEVAELLDIGHSYYVEKIHSLSKDSIEVMVENLGGSKQRRKMTLPALISVTKNIAYPELPTVKRKLQARKIDVETITLQDLAGFMDESNAGLAGSPTKVVKIEVPPPPVKERKIYRNDYENFTAAFAELIRN